MAAKPKVKILFFLAELDTQAGVYVVSRSAACKLTGLHVQGAAMEKAQDAKEYHLLVNGEPCGVVRDCAIQFDPPREFSAQDRLTLRPIMERFEGTRELSTMLCIAAATVL